MTCGGLRIFEGHVLGVSPVPQRVMICKGPLRKVDKVLSDFWWLGYIQA